MPLILASSAILVGSWFLFSIFGPIHADCVATASISTWEDADANGERDTGESPLAYVIIEELGKRRMTDSSGELKIDHVGARWCREGIAVDAIAPAGFNGTTSLSVELPLGAQEGVEFGFISDDLTQPNVPFPFCSAETPSTFVTCQIERAYCGFRPDIEGQPTFCTDSLYPAGSFTLLVWGQDWSDYDGRCLRVTGEVALFRGFPQIVATSRDQVNVCR